MENKLETNGFVVFRNVLDPSLSDQFIVDKKVNYAIATDYIDNYMLKKVNEIMDWDSVYTKYRISDNNNSNDASTFHRDIIPSNNKELLPSFTCLTYFDKTTMELISGSHKQLQMSHSDSFKTYFNNIIKITMNPGDVLLFYSTLLHRGIFTENLPNRRLIQVFEVFPNVEEWERCSGKIHHLLGDNSYNERMISISKNKILNSIMNYYAYLNASTGYTPLDEYDYISSESRCERLDIDGTFQDSNRYIVRRPNKVIDPERKDIIMYQMFYKKTIAYLTLTFVILVLLSYTFYTGIRKA